MKEEIPFYGTVGAVIRAVIHDLTLI